MNDLEKFRPIIRGCLQQVYNDFIDLGQERTIVVNRSVDFSTKADEVISHSLRRYFESLPDSYVILSEEQENQTDTDATWTVICDELDGTANLISGGSLPFGPVIAITSNIDPSFSDITSMGFLVIPSGDLYEAYRDFGASVITGWIDGNTDSQPLSTTGRTRLSGEPFPNILVDQYMLGNYPELAQTLWSMGYPGDFRSWAYHMALVARGAYDLAITGDHCALNDEKRATAEELAGGYLLIKEAGGEITTWDGDCLGPKRIGMADEATFDVTVAASEELAKATSKRVRETIQ